jgi:hypothetical protein
METIVQVVQVMQSNDDPLLLVVVSNMETGMTADESGYSKKWNNERHQLRKAEGKLDDIINKIEQVRA